MQIITFLLLNKDFGLSKIRVQNIYHVQDMMMLNLSMVVQCSEYDVELIEHYQVNNNRSAIMVGFRMATYFPDSLISVEYDAIVYFIII